MLPRLSAIAVAGLVSFAPSALFAFDPAELGKAWTGERFVKTPAPCLMPAELAARLGDLKKLHPELELEEIGRSVEQRPIYLMRIGQGEKKVLLWSQMHGDEPSATPALLDLTHYLLSHQQEPEVAKLLSGLELLMVPMLNPDGAEVYTRRNAQGIDINRDARNLATPEGRLLKSLREQYQPMLGFNLHDQNRRRTVGTSDVLATNAVLAVVGDEEKTLTPGRILAKRAAVAVAAALEPFAPGGLARYDDTYSPRSFGDNITGWGTPVLLIESGGLPPGTSLEELTRLNFVALLTTLAELAQDNLAGRDPDLYDKIPENNADVYSDVVLRSGKVRQPGLVEAYRADLAFDVKRGDRQVAGCPAAPGLARSEIAELGDARVFAAGRDLDVAGQIAFPAFTLGAEGLGARKLLDGQGLEALARLGVAKVRWVVAARNLAAALDYADSVQGARRPRLDVSTDRKSLPQRVLARQPAEPASRQLGEVVRVLEEASKQRFDGNLEASLAALWQGAPPLRYEGSATFLMARAGNQLEAASELTSIFVDGIEIEGATP